jgi:hypothetical protein
MNVVLYLYLCQVILNNFTQFIIINLLKYKKGMEQIDQIEKYIRNELDLKLVDFNFFYQIK